MVGVEKLSRIRLFGSKGNLKAFSFFQKRSLTWSIFSINQDHSQVQLKTSAKWHQIRKINLGGKSGLTDNFFLNLLIEVVYFGAVWVIYKFIAPIFPSPLLKPKSSLEYFPAQNFERRASTVITIMNQISFIVTTVISPFILNYYIKKQNTVTE